jgi:hypothetical protein
MRTFYARSVMARPIRPERMILVNKNSLFCILAFVCFAFNLNGCHRGYYRRQADKEAEHLIRQKQNDPRWANPDASIETHPESRLHDPFSADHPPMPFDDPASHNLMENVDCKPGFPHWHANGDTQYTENPEWLGYLPINDDGVVELDLSRAVTMGLVHSPEYQQQRETLYLSALDVSLERFGFDTQMASTWNSFFQTNGRFRTGESQSLWQVAAPGTGMQLTKLGITGSTLVVGLANSLVWNFSGPNTQSATTLLDFSLVQPLLRGAGRDRIMESLTLTERNLLANVRQMERFRRGFYLQITTGRNPGAGPSRGGGFLSPPAGASSNAGGMMGLLQSQQNIRIQESNVASLRNVLKQFQAYLNADTVNPLLVRQAESQLYSAQQSLLSLRTSYDANLDTFKRTLGLPPSLPMLIKDPLLDQFELIDDDIIKRQNSIGELQDLIGEVLTTADSLIDPATEVRDEETDKITAIGYNDQFGKKVSELRPLIEQAMEVRRGLYEESLIRIEKDIERHEAAKPRRIEYLKGLRSTVEQRYRETGKLDIELSILSERAIEDTDVLRESLRLNRANLETIVGEFESLLELVDKLVNEGKTLDGATVYKTWEQIAEDLPTTMARLGTISLEMSLLQALARTDTINLNLIEMNAAQAYEIARGFRRDWMNARAALVDQYRQIEVAADDLESQLDLVFEGDMGNLGDNPFRLRYETGSLRAGFRFDAPLTRLFERNQYRNVLINYQQSRRAYYLFQDEISRNLRQTIRLIELNKILFELNRRAVKTAVQSVELAQLDLVNPANIQLGPNASRNLTDALNQLQRSQNDLLSSWVAYEVLRRSLDFDLGTMQLTPDGFWIDPGEITPEIAYKAAAAFGLDPTQIMNPDNFLNNRPLFEDSSLDLTAPNELDSENNEPNMLNPIPQQGEGRNELPQFNSPNSGLFSQQSGVVQPVTPPLSSPNPDNSRLRTASRFVSDPNR